MTYKSIGDMLAEHASANPARLLRFVPAFDADESERREMWMPPALHDWLYQQDRKKSREFSSNIRAFLGRFVKGGEIDNQDYMKNWVDDVWELRVQNQRPGERVRIFGAFIEPDKFVAFFQKPRSAFGGKDDPKWKEAAEKVVDEWNRFFPARRRVPARPFSRCITFALFDVNER